MGPPRIPSDDLDVTKVTQVLDGFGVKIRV
jgi:hypothetical protein